MRDETGIQELRRVAKATAWCTESAFDGFTAEQCLNLMRACAKSEWDIFPDELTPEERAEAAQSGLLPEGANARLNKRFLG